MHVLITHAIQQECISIKPKGFDFNQLITGVGKVNSVVSLYESIHQKRPDFVLNIGTAGSLHHPVGSIVMCSLFRDRDMEPCKDFGVTYFHSFSHELTRSNINPTLYISNTCNTGDSFVTLHPLNQMMMYLIWKYLPRLLCAKNSKFLYFQ